VSADAGLGLRPARPADLPQLEAWCYAGGAGGPPPYISVTLSTFEREPGREVLLILSDGGAEVGFVVLSWLWSNRLRAASAVIDDWLVTTAVDDRLVVHEAARFARARGAARVLVHEAAGRLRVLAND